MAQQAASDDKFAEARACAESDLAHAQREREVRGKRRQIRLYLIRHGESTANEHANYVGGRASHAQLSDKGEEQCLRLGSHFAAVGIKFDMVFSSTSQRAKQSAELVCAELGIDPSIIVCSDQLLEQCHGGWEGLRRDEVYTPEMLEYLEYHSWQFRPPGKSKDDLESESQRQVEERMVQFVEQHILARPEGEPNKVFTAAIFGHGLAIKFFLRAVMQSSPYLSRKMRIDNTAIVELGYDSAPGSRGGWQVYRINDHAHIKNEKVFTRTPVTPTGSLRSKAMQDEP